MDSTIFAPPGVHAAPFSIESLAIDESPPSTSIFRCRQPLSPVRFLSLEISFSILLLFLVLLLLVLSMTSSNREFRDENPVDDQSSWTPTTQRAIEEITWDEPDEVSSR